MERWSKKMDGRKKRAWNFAFLLLGIDKLSLFGPRFEYITFEGWAVVFVKDLREFICVNLILEYVSHQKEKDTAKEAVMLP
jgi:hypothetical protein